jgi:integrase
LGLHNNDLYRQYNLSLPDGNIKFLEWREVKMLLDVKLDTQMEQDARDLFCFSCLTGLRYSDVSQLRYSQIKEHRFEEMEEVQYAVHVNQIKTHKPAVAPLLKEALEIIARHKDKDKEFALPQRELQSVNRTLKEVAKKAGIKSTQEVIVYRGNQREVRTNFKHELISTHWARRTFCTCAGLKSIPITVACSITGLSPKVMLKHYMGVIDSKKFEEVQNKLQF